MAASRKRSKLRNGIEIAIMVCLVLASIAGMYLSDGYKASQEAVDMITHMSEYGTEHVTGISTADDYFAYIPANPKAGLIFYPGGLVEHEAYAPLMMKLADQGILAVCVKMPFDLAVLKKGAAKSVLDQWKLQYPDLDWYIGGHSLGGVMAASYVADHLSDFEGIIFLASYTTTDLSKSGLKAISLYGSEDGVLNMEKYQAAKENLPMGYTEYVIEGGCHAGFGDYGVQKGDKEPSISKEEQMSITAEEIANWLE